MEQMIKITELNVSSFKNLGIMTIPIGTREMYVVGRNSVGKSSILDAIVWTLFDCDRFGANLSPLSTKDANTVTGKVKYVTDYGIENEAIRTHSSNSKRVYYGLPKVSKKTFIAATNPMYAVNMTPASLKDIIIECSPLSHKQLSKIVGDIWIDVLNKYLNGVISRTDKVSIIYGQVEAKLSEYSKQNKLTAGDLDKLYAQQALISELNEVGVIEPKEFSETIALKINEAKNKIRITSEIIEELKSTKDIIAITATVEFAKHFKDLKIQITNPEGKEVYFLTYKDKNVRTLSNSEMLNAGLEFCNSLMEWMNVSYPIIIDNGESILNVDFSKFPQISQVIATLVADEDLSSWSNQILTGIESKIPMPRTKEAIMPTTSILCDWTNILPTKEVAMT